MKIPIDVGLKFLAAAGSGWVECEGVRLAQRHDDSFELLITTDIAEARERGERIFREVE